MNPRAIALTVAAVLLLSVPYWVPGVYYVNVTSQILFFAIFALGLNVLVGYGGLVSLGHAGLFGVAAYAAGYMLHLGHGHPLSIIVALVIGIVSMAMFAVLSLRSTGIGFIMITLALGQILWGLAYRWISVTGGDNGITLHGRPAPFGFELDTANSFYYMTLVIFVITIICCCDLRALAARRRAEGTRDQPRRINALGYHVWAIRFWACLFSGLLTAVSAILFVYYNQFISPQTLALTSSAEVLLMVISGGAGTCSARSSVPHWS